MYTIERLRDFNHLDSREEIQNSQVEHVNKIIQLIESRPHTTPQIGDILEYTDEYGEWYPAAHIDRIKDGIAEMCLTAGSYVFASPLHFCTSGGPWKDVPIAGFVHIGKRNKRFRISSGDILSLERSLEFEAAVSVWKYIEPDRKYGDYTTRNWNKYIFHQSTNSKDRSQYGAYFDFMKCKVIDSEEDFKAWEKTYKAKVFEGPCENNLTVFCYREKLHIVSKDAYERLKFPVDTRRNNSSMVLVKVLYNDETHVVHAFSYAGEVYEGAVSGTTHKDLIISRYYPVKEFELARHGINWYEEIRKRNI